MPSNKSATKPKSNPLSWEWSFDAIGTQWWIGVYEPIQLDGAALQHKIARLIDDFDDTFSRFRAGSLVTRMFERAGAYKLPAYAAPMINLYQRLYDLTDGQVTPLVGQLLSDAGYDSTYSLEPKSQLKAVPSWEETLSVEENNVLRVKQPVLLDFGAAGKGFLVDLVSDLLRLEGLQKFCVDAGGDMYVYGLGAPLKIGLENPNDSSQVIGVADLEQGALCGSAPNRRAWGRYHHIMDPAARKSTETLSAVWVQADSALLADGLATALFFADPGLLRKHFEFAYALVYADGSLRYSQNFSAEFFN